MRYDNNKMFSAVAERPRDA